MKIRLRKRLWSHFSNNPGIVVAFMFIAVVVLVIVGASQKEVTIIDGTTKKEVMTYKTTVGDILGENRIELNNKDKIWPELESLIKDGTKISIRRAIPVTVAIDGKEMQFLSAEETVEDMLTSEGITYGKIDKVYPETDTAVSDGMKVRIVRVAEEEIIERHTIAYSKEIKQMPEWEKGVEKELREGSEGEKIRKIKITYEDGAEKSRELLGEEITKPPVSHLTAVGTLDWRTVSRGETIKFKKMMVMKATSYTDDIACTGKIGGNTATGTKPRRNSDGGKWSTVAVDPKLIPLGTKLWIEGYGFAIAEDVGGAVKGSIIDLFFTNGTQEYLDWHTHKTRVYILE